MSEKCNWKPRWPGDYLINCTGDHELNSVGRVDNHVVGVGSRIDHHTKDSFIGFKLLHGFHHPIPDLKMMIYAMELYAIGGDLLEHEKDKKRHKNLLKRLRQELETVEAAVAHLPVGDEP